MFYNQYFELHRLSFLATVWPRSQLRAFTNTMIGLSLTNPTCQTQVVT